MSSPAASAMHLPRLPRFAPPDQGRISVLVATSSRPGRAALLLLVSTAHLLALWAIWQSVEAADEVSAQPLIVELLDTVQPIALPPPVPAPAPTVRPARPPIAKPNPPPPVRVVEARKSTPRVHAEIPPAGETLDIASTATKDVATTDGPALPPQAGDAPAAPLTPTPVPSSRARFDVAYLNNPAPAYPGLARRLGEEGTVRLRVWVSREGRAGKVELAQSTGSPRLDRAALETVSRWRFEPARENGAPVEQWVIVPIKFKLENQDR